jgi:hypothetical protein
MKTFLNFASCFAILAAWPAANSKATDVSIFYEQHEPYGEWVEVGDYGYCWHPRDIDNDWRPYTTGNWAYTDAGWTWVSDEPFGWAVYHYGRWTRAERVGWIWVPDTEWGPAWVSWRNSDRHVGWAPLPPESRLSVGVAIGGWVDAAFDIGPAYYNFVEVRNLGAPRLRSVLLSPRENITIINQTTNITKITYQNNIVINNGPDYNVVSRQAAQPIRRLKLERREQADLRSARAEQLNSKIQGESLVVAAPPIQKAPNAKPKKVGQKIEKAAIDRGWKDAGDAKQVETVRAKFKQEAKDIPADVTAGTTERDRSPTAAPTADTKVQPAGERPPTTAETAEPKPGAESPTKPGREKGTVREGREGRRTAGEAKPASPGEAKPPTTDPTAPAKVDAPDQPGVARETDQPGRPDKQRGKKGQPREKSPDAIAEDLKTPPEPQPDAKPSRPEPQPDTERPGGRRAPAEVDRPERATPEQKVKPNRPEGREQAQPDRPAEKPDRPAEIDRPAKPERRNVPEQAERGPSQPSPGRGAEAGAREIQRQRPAAQPNPQAQPQRPPKPDAPGGPGEKKDENKKKGEPEPQ